MKQKKDFAAIANGLKELTVSDCSVDPTDRLIIDFRSIIIPN